MDRETRKIDGSVRVCQQIQAQDSQLDLVFKLRHSAISNLQNLIYFGQKHIQIDVNPQRNQFLSQGQQQKVHKGNMDTATNSSSSKPRKKRTYLNVNIIKQMSQAFNRFQQQRSTRFRNTLTLKKIAEDLNLSQVTVLRKYRQFKHYGVIRKGVKEKTNENRSYRKTQEMHQIIEECLEFMHFDSASQLVCYIRDRYGKQFNRFQVRYYMKKLDHRGITREAKRKWSCENRYSAIDDRPLFFAGSDYYTKDLTYFNISLICGQKGLLFLVARRPQKHPFDELLDCYFQYYGKINNWLIITGEDQLQKQISISINRCKYTQSLLQALDQRRGKYYCLSPEFEKYNLAKNILTKNSIDFYKPESYFVEQITIKLQEQKRQFSSQLFSQFTNQLSRQADGRLTQNISEFYLN